MGLVASLVIALVFIPLAALKLSTGKEKGEPGAIAWSRKYYVRSLGWVLRNRLDAFIDRFKCQLWHMKSLTVPYLYHWSLGDYSIY